MQRRRELAEIDGLGEVRVGTVVEAADAVRALVAPGEHHDAHARLATQPLGEIEAIGIGQADVEDHDIERRARHRVGQFGRAAQRFAVEAVAAQPRHEDTVAQRRIVFDQGDARRRWRHDGRHRYPG